MPSRFPGMDPFLEDERLWPWFQHQLILTLHRRLTGALADRYHVLVTERRCSQLQPSHCEEYIELRSNSEDRLVTILEVVSLVDKLTEAGREAYLATRHAAKEAEASIVEIDLLLQGKPMLDYSREGLPEWDYSVTVTRSSLPERYEIYTSMLQKRLPRFKFPLASNDRDTVLDLQSEFVQAYEDGGFESQIDYGREFTVPLSDETRGWMNQLLRDQLSGS